MSTAYPNTAAAHSTPGTNSSATLHTRLVLRSLGAIARLLTGLQVIVQAKRQEFAHAPALAPLERLSPAGWATLPSGFVQMTDLERTVLAGIIAGKTSREIARLRGSSEEAVKQVITRLFDKYIKPGQARTRENLRMMFAQPSLAAR